MKKDNDFDVFDCIVIGGGVCGASVLYRLTQSKGKFLLLEKENDLACGESKANSGIVHAGYDPEHGTLMAKYNVKGNEMIRQMAVDLDISFETVGSLVIAFDETERTTLNKLLERGTLNGVKGLRIIERDELRAIEPNISSDALCALHAPSAGVIAPWELSIAQAECAVNGGARVELECKVTAIKKQGELFVLQTNKGQFRSKFVVNAAGVHSDDISNMIEKPHFAIKPFNGEYFLLDKQSKQNKLVNHVVFPCPTPLGKGVLVAPTIHGNVIVGPDVKESDREDVTTTAKGLDKVRQTALKCIPSLNLRTTIRNFTGVRANSDCNDFIVGESKTVKGFYNVAGIRSPGLSSCTAIALDIVDMLHKAGLDSTPNPNFVTKRHVVKFRELDPKQKAKVIKDNPLYGNIVCRCETVTEGEIVDALNRPLPPRSVDGIKRRTTAGFGRCQGGFCTPKVVALIAKRFGIEWAEVTQDKAGSYIVEGRTKEE